MLNAGQARVDEARAAPPELSPIDLCEDFSCGKGGAYTRDGECDDGGYGSVSSVCDFGTDCADCGMRPKGTPIPLGTLCGRGRAVHGLLLARLCRQLLSHLCHPQF